MKIKDIKAYEILDSRGNPTVEAQVILQSGVTAFSSVPSGASTGAHEAHEKRDGDPSRFGGKGVLKAKNNIETLIRDALIGRSCFNQAKIDRVMKNLDGTADKSNLGANAMLAVSQAVCRAAATQQGIPLWRYIGGINSYMMPLPMMNVLNGGAHADNNLDIQEFMIVPSGAKTFAKGVMMCAEIYSQLKGVLKSRGLSTAVGDEGGFAPNLEDDEEALELLCEAIEKAGFRAGEDVKIALDVAASEWFQKGIYKMPKCENIFTGDELCNFYDGLVAKYPIISIEDGAAQDDIQTWKLLTKRLATRVQLVGDDLFVTNTVRLQRGLEEGIANSILIKPNQIGTVTETLDAVHLAKEHGYGTVVSHRSGETADTFIADLAVGLNAGQIKTGAPCRSERCAKYNRLMYIEEMML